MVSVGLNPIGFYAPLYLASFIIVVLAGYRRFRITKASLRDYLAVFLAIIVVSVILFQIAPDPQSLSIPQDWSLGMMLGSGVLYSLLFTRKRLITTGMLEAFAIGTYAMITNDAVRTFVLPLSVSLPIIYWGGNGTQDLIVQFGIFMWAAFTTVSGSVAIWQGRLIEKLVGRRWAEVFWAQFKSMKRQTPAPNR